MSWLTTILFPVSLETPRLDGPQVGLESQQAEHRVDVQIDVLVRSVVVYGDGFDRTVAADLSDLVKRLQIDVTGLVSGMELINRRLVGPEAVPAMHHRELCGPVLQAECPVQGGVATPDDEDLLAEVVVGVLYRVVDALAEQIVIPGALEVTGFESALAAGNEHRPARVLTVSAP